MCSAIFLANLLTVLRKLAITKKRREHEERCRGSTSSLKSKKPNKKLNQEAKHLLKEWKERNEGKGQKCQGGWTHSIASILCNTWCPTTHNSSTIILVWLQIFCLNYFKIYAKYEWCVFICCIVIYSQSVPHNSPMPLVDTFGPQPLDLVHHRYPFPLSPHRYFAFLPPSLVPGIVVLIRLLLCWIALL